MGTPKAPRGFESHPLRQKFIDHSMITLLTYLLTGIISSFLSGLLGIGGGLIIVPALSFIFAYFHIMPPDYLMHMVIGTSMAGAVINLAFSLHSQHKQNNIEWLIFKRFSVGIIIGSLLVGPIILFYLSNAYLKIIFGCACLGFGMQMFFQKKTANIGEDLPGPLGLSLWGFITGIISVLVGVAGGTMIGTILNHYHMDMRKVIGTTTAVALLLTLTGTAGLLVLGYYHPTPLAWSTGFVYWPAVLGIAIPSPILAPLGVKVGHLLPTHILRKSFACILLIVAIKMIIQT